MTDKQIIIDGVDVSGCGYIDQDSAYCDLCLTNCYKITLPCYYKQLKRAENQIVELNKMVEAKEQECEELKNFHINLVGVKECEIRELAELEAENRSLKAYIKILENNNEVNKCENQ